jgi:DNA-directed RNA polymerase specialized sigma24 family protein
MTAEQYIQRVRHIDIILQNKLKEYKRWVDTAEGLGGISTGDRVQTSRNLQKIPDAIGRYIDLERDIEALKRERQNILRVLESLPSDEYDLLYKLYVEDFKMKELAYFYKKSYDWVKKKKRLALRDLQRKVDERATEGA